MGRRPAPEMTTDEEAEACLDQGLSDLDFTRHRPPDRGRPPRTARIPMRVPEERVRAL